MIKKNIFSILVGLLIVFLSLTSSGTFENSSLSDIPYIDKIAHLGMYFLLMSVIVFEHRKSIKNTEQLFLMSLIPFFFGILMEVFQFILTSDRNADLKDVLFNSAGIIFSLLLWLIIKPFYKQKVR